MSEPSPPALAAQAPQANPASQVTAAAAKPPKRVVRVAVAGGGIAGLTAALRLAQRGYRVTLYEEKPWLGGNLSSQRDPATGLDHDVYPHMFSNFYVNFWDIAEKELGLKRSRGADTDFEARDSFWFLSRAGYTKLQNASGPVELLRDMFAGVEQVGPLDMYLYLYSVLDLMAHDFDERGLLGLSLNGFVQSRPCVTEPVALLHDATVMFVWSVHSAATSAASYQNFNRHTFNNVKPLLWLLRGSLRQRLIDPLEQRLLSLGCRIVKNASVRGVTVTDGRATAIELRAAQYDEAAHKVVVGDEPIAADPFDHLVLAVPPKALGHLADAGCDPRQRLSHALPRLSHAGKRLPAVPIAVMDLYFKRRLPGIPKENVAVTDSDCYFSFIDISQLWPGPEMQDITALTLASSDYWALPSDDDHENAHHLILELQRYLGNFKAGNGWGDPDCDIDWTRTRFRSNKDDVIFLNQVGSWEYRPPTHEPRVANVYYAGDFCRNQVDMATVEAAVTSGINAAAALQASDPLGEPIVPKRPPMVPDVLICALKLWMAPSAYAAKAWVTMAGAARESTGAAPVNAVTRDLSELASLPAAYVADTLGTMGTLARHLVDGGAEALSASQDKRSSSLIETLGDAMSGMLGTALDGVLGDAGSRRRRKRGGGSAHRPRGA